MLADVTGDDDISIIVKICDYANPANKTAQLVIAHPDVAHRHGDNKDMYYAYFNKSYSSGNDLSVALGALFALGQSQHNAADLYEAGYVLAQPLESDDSQTRLMIAGW